MDFGSKNTGKIKLKIISEESTVQVKWFGMPNAQECQIGFECLFAIQFNCLHRAY